MKRLLLSTLGAFVVGTPAVAQAGPLPGPVKLERPGPKIYVKADVGAAVAGEIGGGDAEFDLDEGVNTGGAIGIDFGRVRAEAELRYSSSDLDIDDPTITAADADALYGFVNVYAEPVKVLGIEPFLGVGIGVVDSSIEVEATSANVNVGAVDLDDDANSFAYQLIGGVAYDVNRLLTIEGSVRYIDTLEGTFDNASTSEELDFDRSETVAAVGLRIRF